MKTIITCAVLSALMWGDLMPISTIVELPRDVWITVRTKGGHELEGLLADSDDHRVILDGDRRHYILAEAIESVTVEKDKE